jgi:hypothetical protein
LFAELIATVRVPKPLQVTADIVLDCPTRGEVKELQRPNITEEEAQRLIFKDHYDAAMELFDDKPLHVWNEFMKRYNAHFFGEPDAGK